MKGNGITYRDAFVRSCLNDKRDTTPRATANLYVANFRSDVLDFSTYYYLRPTPRVHRSRATQRRKTAVGRRTTPNLSRDFAVEASRNDPFWHNRDFPNADSYCFCIAI